jgi:protein transport protein SEC13
MSVSTLVNIETQHNEMIHDAQLDYYSRKLATASSDRTIEVCQCSTCCALLCMSRITP